MAAIMALVAIACAPTPPAPAAVPPSESPVATKPVSPPAAPVAPPAGSPSAKLAEPSPSRPAASVVPAPSASVGAAATASVGVAVGGTGQQSRFFSNAEYEKQLAERKIKPEGPDDQPWLQAIQPVYTDTTKYKKAGPWNICFSNASLDSSWRTVGWTTMQAEASLNGDITLNAVDAGGRDEKQISDLADLSTQKCDAILVSPNTTTALTPAVQRACDTGVPIVVFDRGVSSDCPVTFIHPVGGYAFGADAAEFLTRAVKKGGKVLALRMLPGVDVQETRWAAAKVIFDAAGLDVVGVEFTDGDPARVKALVGDYIRRAGTIDGVWLDSGSASVAAAEAFEEAHKPIPPITGEDEQDFLRKWKGQNLNAVAPTYPTYQWRTAIVAARMILNGEKVPKEWVLPQPVITVETLDHYLAPKMPPSFYTLCGCQKMPGFPGKWGGSE